MYLFRIMDAQNSNALAEACYFATHHKLVVMEFGDELPSPGTRIIDVSELGLAEGSELQSAIGETLKSLYETRFVYDQASGLLL